MVLQWNFDQQGAKTRAVQKMVHFNISEGSRLVEIQVPGARIEKWLSDSFPHMVNTQSNC